MVIHSDWSEISVPDFPEIPTMLTPQERRYLYWLASTQYRGIGEIVEVGTWLGGSTACLASGLALSAPQKKLHCYDNFVWIAGYAPRANGLQVKEGGDFHPYFRKFIDAHFENVLSTKNEIKDIVWNGGEIEILFLDAPKNKADMLECIEIFFPHLIPGKSIVVFQDFNYSPAYAIPAVIAMMGDALELVHAVDSASTLAFRYVRALDTFDPAFYDYETIPTSELDKKWDALANQLPKSPADFLAIGRAMMLFEQGRLDEAVSGLGSRKLGPSASGRYKFYVGMPYLKRKYGALFDAVPVR